MNEVGVFQGEAGLMSGRCGSRSRVSAAFSIEHLLCSKVSTSSNGGKREAPLSRVLVLNASLRIGYPGTPRRDAISSYLEPGRFVGRLLSGNEGGLTHYRLSENMPG